MATLDLTADGNGLSAGVRRRVRKYGALEEHTILLDETKLVAYSAVAAADILQVIDIGKGDRVLGGFGQVITAGGVATATFDLDFSGGTANGIVAALDADAAAGTMGSVSTTAAETATTADTIDITVNTAGLASGGAGQWQFTVWLLRGSEIQGLAYGNTAYANDPNLPPQT